MVIKCLFEHTVINELAGSWSSKDHATCQSSTQPGPLYARVRTGPLCHALGPELDLQ